MIKTCSREQFVSAVSDDPADKFTKFFIKMSDDKGWWGMCEGLFDEDGDLMGAIINREIKRSGVRFTQLQLLHTFAKHRRKGVGKKLALTAHDFAVNRGISYFRIMAEQDARPFYESIGFEVVGQQKAGHFLILGRVQGEGFSDYHYELDDKVIHHEACVVPRGGCVELFKEPPTKKVQDITSFL